MPAAAPALSVTAPPAPVTRRPRLLIAAARHGISEYRSARDLPRLIGPGMAAGSVLSRLVEMEARLEEARQAGDPGWSCLRHVEVMIALLAERALRAE